MNPALLLLLLPFLNSTGKAVKSGTKTVYEDTKTGIWDSPVFLLTVVGLLLWASSKWNQSKQETYLNKAGNDVEVNQATSLYQALYANGVFVPITGQWIGTTDEEALYAVARQIKDFSKVADAYTVIYSRNLTTDINKELSVDEATKFWGNVRLGSNSGTGSGSSSTPTTTTTSTKAGKKVIATRDFYIRKFNAPGTTVRQVKANDEIGVYVSETYLLDIPNKGDKTLYIHVQESVLLGLFTYDYYALASNCKLV